MTALECRFWAKVRKTAGCWFWVANKWPDGYGQIKVGGMPRLAHRIAWFLTYGEVPPGLFVLHRCDNKPCVRPTHLFLGTHTDNMADEVEKGRQARGERNSHAKLTEQDVIAIRALTKTHDVLAREFRVSPALISCIKTRKLWKHI